MQNAKKAGSGLVYSTDSGRMCPDCRAPLRACRCAQQAAVQTQELRASRAVGGAAKVMRESKGRGGKTATVVRGLPMDDLALAAFGKLLKVACGSGGTVKDGVVEVQGDHVETVMQFLAKHGHAAKNVFTIFVWPQTMT